MVTPWGATMACVIYCSGNDARYIPPEKEAFYPGPLSIYSRFWVAGSPWQLLLSPGWGPGPATDRVPPVPGIYELAISRKPAPNALVTVYVGKSSNLRARQQQYLRDGDHLASLVHAILEEGCCIWYRYRVLKSDLQAQRWEARFLLDYDCTSYFKRCSSNGYV